MRALAHHVRLGLFVNNRWPTILLLLGVARVASADQTASTARQVFTLDAAIAFAKDHQPRIQEALQEIVVEQRAAAVPRSQWLPQITGGAELVGGTVNTTTASFFAIPDL